MRPETQKQIVKAFSMMYEDSDIPLEELINKLQHLNGQKKEESAHRDYSRVKGSSIISDDVMLAVFEKNVPLRLGQIRKGLGMKFKEHVVQDKLRKLISSEKIRRVKINSHLHTFVLA